MLEVMEENKEKEEKKTNLVIYNLEETQCENRQERIDNEIKCCEKIFRETEIEATSRNIVEVKRLSKYTARDNAGRENTPKPKPLLVKLT